MEVLRSFMVSIIREAVTIDQVKVTWTREDEIQRDFSRCRRRCCECAALKNKRITARIGRRGTNPRAPPRRRPATFPREGRGDHRVDNPTSTSNITVGPWRVTQRKPPNPCLKNWHTQLAKTRWRFVLQWLQPHQEYPIDNWAAWRAFIPAAWQSATKPSPASPIGNGRVQRHRPGHRWSDSHLAPMRRACSKSASVDNDELKLTGQRLGCDRLRFRDQSKSHPRADGRRLHRRTECGAVQRRSASGAGRVVNDNFNSLCWMACASALPSIDGDDHRAAVTARRVSANLPSRPRAPLRMPSSPPAANAYVMPIADSFKI